VFVNQAITIKPKNYISIMKMPLRKSVIRTVVHRNFVSLNINAMEKAGSIQPFEAVHGSRPTYIKKDEVFKYIESMSENINLIRDMLYVLATQCDKNHPVSRRIISIDDTVRSMLEMMYYELDGALKTLDPETRFFILGQQIKLEFETLKQKFGTEHLRQVISTYNELPYIISKAVGTAECTVIPNHNKIGEDHLAFVAELSERFGDIAEAYRNAIDRVLESRLDEFTVSAAEGKIKLSAITVDDRIAVHEDLKDYFLGLMSLLTLDKHGETKGDSMVLASDVKYIVQSNFIGFGEAVPRKRFNSAMYKTHLRSFMYRVYQEISSSRKELPQYRLLLQNNFEDFKDDYDISDTFAKVVDIGYLERHIKRLKADFKRNH